MCFYHFDENGLMTKGYLVTNLWERLELRERANQPVDVEARNKATVQRYIDEVLNGKNYSKALEMITPDYTLYYGGEEIAEKGLDLFKNTSEWSKPLSKMVLHVDQVIAQGDSVAVQYHDDVIHDNGPFLGYEVVPGQEAVTWHGVVFFKLNKEGLLTEGRAVSNDLAVFEMRKRAAEQADQN